MPVKTPVKKTTKSAQKPVKKMVKKITQSDIEANFVRMQKSQDEAWKAIRETQQAHKETEKAIKETQKNIGGLNNTLGSLVERIMTPDLPRKFKSLGFTFDKITTIKWATDGNI
jgi:septal ring factor EnvC (AmiA/AmiB activator)